MTQISLSDVKKLAQMSALQLTEVEEKRLAAELPEILAYVEQLKQVDTRSIDPTYQVNDPQTVTRKDEIVDYRVSQEDLLKNAPDADGHQIKVPRVLE